MARKIEDEKTAPSGFQLRLTVTRTDIKRE